MKYLLILLTILVTGLISSCGTDAITHESRILEIDGIVIAKMTESDGTQHVDAKIETIHFNYSDVSVDVSDTLNVLLGNYDIRNVQNGETYYFILRSKTNGDWQLIQIKV